MGDSLKRGSVVLAIYPFTDLSSAKRRPAQVVSATGRPGRDCILAFITSRTSQIEATDLMLDPTSGDFAATGLRVASVVRCGKLMTLDRTLLTGRLGRLSEHLMAEVDIRLKRALAVLMNIPWIRRGWRSGRRPLVLAVLGLSSALDWRGSLSVYPFATC